MSLKSTSTVVALAAVVLTGCPHAPSTQPAPTPTAATAAPDASSSPPAGWQTIAAEDGSWQVIAPGTAKVNRDGILVDSAKGAFGVMVRVPGPSVSSEEGCRAEVGSTVAMLEGAGNKTLTSNESRWTPRGGAEGFVRDATIRLPNGIEMRSRWFCSGERLFHLFASGTFQGELERLASSFQLVAPPQPAKSASQAGSAPVPPAPPRTVYTVPSENLEVIVSGDKVSVSRAGKQTWEFCGEHDRESMEGCAGHRSFSWISLIGPYAGAQFEESMECGGPMFGGATTQTIDLRTGEAAHLTELFADADVARALLADPFARKEVGKERLAGLAKAKTTEILAAYGEAFGATADDWSFVIIGAKKDHTLVRVYFRPGQLGPAPGEPVVLGLAIQTPASLRPALAAAATKSEGFLPPAKFGSTCWGPGLAGTGEEEETETP